MDTRLEDSLTIAINVDIIDFLFGVYIMCNPRLFCDPVKKSLKKNKCALLGVVIALWYTITNDESLRAGGSDFSVIIPKSLFNMFIATCLGHIVDQLNIHMDIGNAGVDIQNYDPVRDGAPGSDPENPPDSATTYQQQPQPQKKQ